MGRTGGDSRAAHPWDARMLALNAQTANAVHSSAADAATRAGAAETSGDVGSLSPTACSSSGTAAKEATRAQRFVAGSVSREDDAAEIVERASCARSSRGETLCEAEKNEKEFAFVCMQQLLQ